MDSQAGRGNGGENSDSASENPERLADIEVWRGDLRVLLRILQDSRTPRYASALMIGVLLWGAMPVDPLPDAIPLAGIIDDATVFLIVRAGIYRLVPNEIIEHHAEVVSKKSKFRFGPVRAVASIAIIQVVLVVGVLGAVTSVIL